VVEQLALELQRPDDWSRAAFLPGAPNQTALDMIDRWPEWPQRTLLLHGPSGCGKTHLAHIAAEHSSARIISVDRLDAQSWGDDRHIIVEDCPGPAYTQEALFHLINWVREENGSLLLTSRRAPREWGLTLKDLVSRINAMVSVKIDEPNDILLTQMLVKDFESVGITPSTDVVAFIERRVPRSFKALRETILTLNRAAYAEKARITVPFIKRVMDW